MATPANPDLAALHSLRDTLKEFEVTFPDGRIAHFDHIDVGFMSKPLAYPYVSLHTVHTRAEVRRLGHGGGPKARDFIIDALMAIEYEHASAELGFEHLTQLRWDVFLHLLKNQKRIEGVEYTDFEDAEIQTFIPDEGDFQDWGFYGQIIIPIEITLRGTNVPD